MSYLGEKRRSKKRPKKSCPDRLKQQSIPMSRGSRAATPKSKIVWVRNNNLSKKQLSEQETRTAAHFESISKLLTWFVRLLLFFPVRFRLNSFSADLTFDFRCETIIFSWLPWREPDDLTRPGQRPGEFFPVRFRLNSFSHDLTRPGQRPGEYHKWNP